MYVFYMGEHGHEDTVAKERAKRRKRDHQKRKLRKYIRGDRLRKLKSYVKKHCLDVNHFYLEDGGTLLHYACSLGKDNIFRYLLKTGLDPSIQNASGQLGLHLACQCAVSGNSEVYTDIVLPLVKAHPEHLDVEDVHGRTPRLMLHAFRQEQMNESASSSSESEDAVDDDADWQRRLEAEMEHEYMDSAGRFEDNGIEEESQAETYDEWAGRLNTEFRHKRQAQYIPRNTPASSASSQSRASANRMSEEQKRNFQQKLEQQHEEYKKHVAAQKVLTKQKELLSCKTKYEDRCRELFTGSHDSSSKKLSYEDIPWPYRSKDGLKGIKDFLFCDITDTDHRKKYLKEQQVRWHPDKFMQKCGSILSESDTERILKRAKEISQELNGLVSEFQE